MTASLCFLHFRARLIDWSIPCVSTLLHSWIQIIYLGVPAALTQALNPIAQGFYIRVAAGVGGVQAVAAMATGTRMEAFIYIISIAYGIAIVPFVGQNFGAKAMARVQEARRISIRLAFIYAGITLLFLIPSARFISSWFSADATIIGLSTQYLLIATLGHTGVYIDVWMGQLLGVIGKPKPVMAINLARVFVFIIPLTLIGSRTFGFTGLVIGITVGNLLGGALAYFVTRNQLRKTSAELIVQAG
ncbi:MAG: MATE family efflux transporter [Pontiella sp.]